MYLQTGLSKNDRDVFVAVNATAGLGPHIYFTAGPKSDILAEMKYIYTLCG